MVSSKLLKAHDKIMLDYISLFDRNGFMPVDIRMLNVHSVAAVFNGLRFEINEKQFPMFNRVSKVFNPRTIFIQGYNKMVSTYNELVDVVNSYSNQINELEDIYTALGYLSRKFATPKSKLLYMCENVYRPENYDYCVYLSKKLEEAKSKRVEDDINYFNSEIQNQPNYEYNMNLKKLYHSYDLLDGYTDDILKLQENSKKDIKNEKLDKQFYIETLNKLKNIIDNETEILQEANIDVNNSELLQLNEIKDLKFNKTKPNYFEAKEKFKMVQFFGNDDIGEIAPSVDYAYDLGEWMKICNKYIDIFNVKDIKKFALSQIEEYNATNNCEQEKADELYEELTK